jgi:glutamate racemase
LWLLQENMEGKMAASDAPIGVFDSGVGGLSVLRELRTQLPYESVLYFADQGHVPYGPRGLEQVRLFSEEITRFLLSLDAKLIVVACNAASAAALKTLRLFFPSISFVGMEPAVKPAAETTHTGVVGILATPATFQGALYASVVERFGNGVTILQDTCPGLVGLIERGELDTMATRSVLEKALHPMLRQGIDTIVMGCTHYPFVIPLIKQIVGEQVRVIDPAPAVARQTARLLELAGLRNSGPFSGELRFFTSGNASQFEGLLSDLLGESGQVRPIEWVENEIRYLGASNSPSVP